MVLLSEGAAAPDFSLPADDGQTYRLSDLRGKVVVLYFYPKDDTPGCTKEACAFRQSKGALTRVGAVVLGVSKDTVASHGTFVAKYGLNFPLLSDPDHAMQEAYGVWQEKKRYGRSYMGTVRTTYLIDTKGRIAKVFPNVKVDGHAQAVLDALKAL